MQSIFCICLNHLSVYTGDLDMFLDKSLYHFHGEQAPKLYFWTICKHNIFLIDMNANILNHMYSIHVYVS